MINLYFTKRAYSIAILGPPASGKGTISKWLARDFEADHISTGDLLRSHDSDKSLNSGNLSSDAVVIRLLTEKLGNFKRKFLLDGFPRRLSQAEAFENILNKYNKSLEAVILLNVPDEILIERITDRWIHPASGRTYSYTFSPPKVKGLDDLTNEPLIQRPDDIISSFNNRMKIYRENLNPVSDYYNKKGILFSFSGTSSTEIFSKIIEKFTLNLKEAACK